MMTTKFSVYREREMKAERLKSLIIITSLWRID